MVARSDPIELGLAVDRAAGRKYPLGQQVVDELRRRVQAGSLGPGERLPPVRSLATLLGVTPETVAGAYKRLVDEGYLRGEIGRGTFVAAPPLRAEEDPLAPFEAGGALPQFASPGAVPGPPAQRDLLRLASQPGLVSFAASVAALELAPVEALQRALSDALTQEGAGALQVGATQGFPPLRAAIAELLQQRGLAVDPSAVCVTSGCQQGIDLAAKVFVGAGDTVLVEQPSFLGALEAFRARGARVIGVPIEGDGLRVEALPALIQRHHPKLLYCMPTYQNPTGRSLSADKRRTLLRIAATYDLPIVEDDSAGFIHLQGQAAPPSLKAEDHAGYVIHLGTFSKLIAAGLRLGWLVADPPVFEKLVAAKYASDLSSDSLVQRAVYRLLADGALQAHLVRAHRVPRAAGRAGRGLAQATRATAWSQFRATRGRLQFVARVAARRIDLDRALSGSRSAWGRVCAREPFSSAQRWRVASAAALYGLRLSYSALPPPALERGVRLLSEAWRGILGLEPRGRRRRLLKRGIFAGRFRAAE